MYELINLMAGYPGRSTHHGGLGWSAVSLLRGHGRLALVDTGGYGYRVPLRAQLEVHGVGYDDITDVFLTHCHWDHASNYTLFPKARVYIGREELAWATAQPVGTWEIPEFHVEHLDRSASTERLDATDEPAPGIRALPTPGHTPGHLAYVIDGVDGRLVFAGDAVKNESELLTGDADMTLDAAVSRQSIETVRGLLREDPETTLVCGHDRMLRMTAEGTVVPATQLRAGMKFWRPGTASPVEFDIVPPAA